jgi:hypothetical protein
MKIELDKIWKKYVRLWYVADDSDWIVAAGG